MKNRHMRRFVDDNPFQPWNGINRDNPFAPWNGIDRDDLSACWNNPFGHGKYEEECNKYR